MSNNEDFSSRYQQIFNENFQRLIFHALRFVDDRAEAEDIVADVFFELWRNRDTVNLETGIVTYLYRAVSSRALNVLRRKNVAEVRIELLESINNRRLDMLSDDDTQHYVENGELRTKIQSAIAELPEKCREVFILSYINGLKNKEIAEAMNVSVRTVDAHVYKALHFLREKLKYLLIFIIYFL